MRDKQPAPDAKALEDSYTIVGELRGSEGVRKYMATRRDDGTEVIITLYSAPGGGANNELSHFAADVQLLSSLSHPGMARVYEARWLGKGSLAVVTARVQGRTLAEALRAGEQFSNPRTAVVLQEIWAVLDWARASGVVHRGVTPDNVYLSPASQHVVVALGPMPIPVEGVNDPNGDARTIGALAWSMLTGKAFVAEDAGQPLEELAPDLAIRVVDATEAMVHGARDDQQEPDVPTFVGIVAAGDVLKQAEVELAAMKEEYEEQHRVALSQCENHRLETERMATEQAELLATERADFEQTMSEHEMELSAVRDELQSADVGARAANHRIRITARSDCARSHRTGRADSAGSKGPRAGGGRQGRGDRARRARRDAEGTVERSQHRRRTSKGRAAKARAAPGRATAVGHSGRGARHRAARRRGRRRRVLLSQQRIAQRGAGQAGGPGVAVGGGLGRARCVHTGAGSAHRFGCTAGRGSTGRHVSGNGTTGRCAPRRRRAIDRPANAGRDMAPAPAPVTDAARADSVWARTDSVARQDSLRRDGAFRDTSRPDTTFIRDTSRPPDTSRQHVVRVDTTWLDGGRRDSARRDSAMKRDSAMRDTTRIRPDSIVRVPPR